MFIILLVNMLFLSNMPGEIGYAVPALIAGVYLCTGVVNFKEFLGQWFSPLCVMMAGVIGVATAMSNCGLTTFVADHIVGFLGASPFTFRHRAGICTAHLHIRYLYRSCHRIHIHLCSHRHLRMYGSGT